MFQCNVKCKYIHFISAYSSQHNYIIKAWVKTTCFDFKSHPQATVRTMKLFTNAVECIWDPRWLTILCCHLYHVHNMTYLLYYVMYTVQITAHNCEQSGIPNARNHIVKNFMVFSLAWRWIFKSKRIDINLRFYYTVLYQPTASVV